MAIAGYTGNFIYNSFSEANQTIKKGAFAYVRSSDYGYYLRHAVDKGPAKIGLSKCRNERFP
jgi:hypothetical protein